MQLDGQAMFVCQAPLILASGSPRRRFFLEDLGLEFEVQGAEIDEQVLDLETPVDYVSRLALEKARAISQLHKQSWVLGADTAVVLEGEILGKPVDGAEALEMLSSLAGRWHQVWTGFGLCHAGQEVERVRVVCTEVLFSGLAKQLAEAYVASGEPMDKAGAYGIQGKGGVLVEEIKGSYTNVVGLPLNAVVSEMLQLGVIQVQSVG